MEFVFSILFIVFSLTLICYYICIFKALAVYKPQPKVSDNKPVSILICAKDEAENLKTFLPQIYKQNYPDFEVVLINDRSIDDTFEVMKSFEEQYPDKTVFVNVPRSNDSRLTGNKKYALTLGIKAAHNEHLLLTDADCRPASLDWIRLMTGQFTDKKQIVLGYGKYETQKGFLNKLIRFETLQTAMQYFSYALKGKPYMGVGRNLAYTKSLFMQNNGFYNHLDVLSGDDDLFINEVATADNTTICIQPDSFTVSKPKQDWKSYFYQKRRHISTAKYYQTKHKILLATYSLSLLGFWVTTILLLISQIYLPWVLGLVFLRVAIAWYFQYKIAGKLQEKNLIFWFPVLEISLLSFQMFIFATNIFKKPLRWTN